MDKYMRQLSFLVYAFLLRWPIWLLIWLIGCSGKLKTLFLIYPTDNSECLDFCPNIKWLRNFFSGRPTPAGLIMDGWQPIGIYLVIPDSSMELMRKKSRPMVETIIKRMLWVKKLTGAENIGLAGQLGPIFEKRHGISMEPPFYSSTYGNIFSIQKAVSHLVNSAQKNPWQVSVSIIGGGLLGEDLMRALTADGYQMSIVDVRYTRKGDVKLMDGEEATRQLAGADLVINLLPRGKDFIDCDLHRKIPKTASIIDFSRPPIPKDAVPQNVVMGNRVQSNGIRFVMRLPGGWRRHELPACSMPSLLASLAGLPLRTIEDFRLAARQFQFNTALAGAPVPAYKTAWNKFWDLAAVHPVTVRFMLLVLRSRQAFSR